MLERLGLKSPSTPPIQHQSHQRGWHVQYDCPIANSNINNNSSSTNMHVQHKEPLQYCIPSSSLHVWRHVLFFLAASLPFLCQCKTALGLLVQRNPHASWPQSMQNQSLELSFFHQNIRHCIVIVICVFSMLRRHVGRIEYPLLDYRMQQCDMLLDQSAQHLHW